MADALEDLGGTVSIGGRTITNLRFADNIDGLAGQEQELVKLVNHLEEASTAYGMQIRVEKNQFDGQNKHQWTSALDITIDKQEKLEDRPVALKYQGAKYQMRDPRPESTPQDRPRTTAAVTQN